MFVKKKTKNFHDSSLKGHWNTIVLLASMADKLWNIWDGLCSSFTGWRSASQSENALNTQFIYTRKLLSLRPRDIQICVTPHIHSSCCTTRKFNQKSACFKQTKRKKRLPSWYQTSKNLVLWLFWSLFFNNKRTSVMCPTAHCHFLGRTSPAVGCWTRGRKKTAHSVSQWKSFTRESTTFNLHLLCCSRWPGLWTHHVIHVCSVLTVRLCLPELMTRVRFICDRCCSKYTASGFSSVPFRATSSLPLRSVWSYPYCSTVPKMSFAPPSLQSALLQSCTFRQLFIWRSKPLFHLG